MRKQRVTDKFKKPYMLISKADAGWFKTKEDLVKFIADESSRLIEILFDKIGTTELWAYLKGGEDSEKYRLNPLFLDGGISGFSGIEIGLRLQAAHWDDEGAVRLDLFYHADKSLAEHVPKTFEGSP